MKGEDIAARLRLFAAGAVQLCRALPDDSAARHIARQLLRAATGGGANYEEARGAESRADFIHKLGLANKEVREALYWLRLTQEAALFADANLMHLSEKPTSSSRSSPHRSGRPNTATRWSVTK
jgi:four helix bundle protein